MSENFQIGYIVLVVSLMLVALVFFIVFSIVQYQKAKGHHLDEMIELRSNFQKEMLASQLESQKNTLDNVSKELHDNIGQILTLARLNLHQVKKNNEGENISQSIEQVDLAIAGIRNVAHLISGNDLANRNLQVLLQNEVDKLNKTGLLKSSLTFDERILKDIGPEKSFLLYRMVQESITNALKHSQANNLDILVQKNNGKIELIVKDDGVGFEVSERVLKSNGLQNLRERASVMDAILNINSTKDVGTKILISIFKDSNVE